MLNWDTIVSRNDRICLIVRNWHKASRSCHWKLRFWTTFLVTIIWDIGLFPKITLTNSDTDHNFTLTQCCQLFFFNFVISGKKKLVFYKIIKNFKGNTGARYPLWVFSCFFCSGLIKYIIFYWKIYIFRVIITKKYFKFKFVEKLVLLKNKFNEKNFFCISKNLSNKGKWQRCSHYRAWKFGFPQLNTYFQNIVREYWSLEAANVFRKWILQELWIGVRK